MGPKKHYHIDLHWDGDLCNLMDIIFYAESFFTESFLFCYKIMMIILFSQQCGFKEGSLKQYLKDSSQDATVDRSKQLLNNLNRCHYLCSSEEKYVLSV